MIVSELCAIPTRSDLTKTLLQGLDKNYFKMFTVF